MLNTLTLLIPALVPSWRFFDYIAPSPRIEFALLEHANDAADQWQEFCPRPLQIPLRHQICRLFWNARWNESLFLVSCAERLIEQHTAHSEQEIFRRIAAHVTPPSKASHLQFRLVLIRRQGTQLHHEVCYVSPAHSFSEAGAP